MSDTKRITADDRLFPFELNPHQSDEKHCTVHSAE